MYRSHSFTSNTTSSQHRSVDGEDVPAFRLARHETRRGGACALDEEFVCLLVCMKVGFCRVEGSSVLLLCNLIGDSKLVNSICRPRLPKISGAGDSIPFGSQIKSERKRSGNICCG